MIKYLGSIGTFIRLNDNDNKTYQLLNVYSSSAANLLLFSAEVNNSTGIVTYDSASTSFYVNGQSGSVIPNQQWAHITFSFDDKLATYDTNNFLIRFGDTASSNFNIQNLYILEQSFSASAVAYLHEEFTGGGGMKVTIHDSASYTFNIVDAPETDFISASTNVIYQPLVGQSRYAFDIDAVEEGSLSRFISASIMQADDLYVDAFNVSEGSFILSLEDDQIYQVTGSSQLITVSASVGDIFRILYGQYLGGNFFVKTDTGFEISPARPKITYYLNTIQTNNI
jgi:hypothetical protein